MPNDGPFDATVVRDAEQQLLDDLRKAKNLTSDTPKVGLAISGGVPTMVAGVVIAYTGFSALDMAINMPANSLLLVWMVVLGSYMWRRSTAAD